MNRQRIIEGCWSVVGLSATTLLLLLTVFTAGAMAQESEEYSIIRLGGLGYFEPVDIDKGSSVNEVTEPTPNSEVDGPSTVSETDKPSPDTGVSESRLTLDIKLSARNPTGCVASSLWLEVEITNTGKKPVIVGKDEVWAYYSYRLFGVDSEEDGEGATYLGGISSDYFTLEVGESYRDTHELILNDNEFFGHEGKYALRSKIESVNSNEVIFELYDCGNTKEEAKEK